MNVVIMALNTAATLPISITIIIGSLDRKSEKSYQKKHQSAYLLSLVPHDVDIEQFVFLRTIVHERHIKRCTIVYCTGFLQNLAPYWFSKYLHRY